MRPNKEIIVTDNQLTDIAYEVSLSTLLSITEQHYPGLVIIKKIATLKSNKYYKDDMPIDYDTFFSWVRDNEPEFITTIYKTGILHYIDNNLTKVTIDTIDFIKGEK